MLPIVSAVLGPALLLVVLAVVAPLSKRRSPLALVLAAIAVGTGLWSGVLLPGDGLALPRLLGLSPEVGALLAWGAYGGLAAAAGGLWAPGPPVVRAVLSGAMIGELGAAASLAQGAADRDHAARLALAAAGGAMLGVVGDPALLVLGPRLGPHDWVLAPLALVMVAIAWPRRSSPGGTAPGATASGNRAVTVVACLVAAGAAVRPSATTTLLIAGAAVMAALAVQRARQASVPRSELLGAMVGPAAWTLGSVVVVLVACAAGLAGLAAQGLEAVATGLGLRLGPILGGLSALGAALVDGPAAGVFSAAMLDRGMELRGVDLGLSVGVGAAVGGLGPLVVAGGLRAGWWRWLLQVLAAMVVVLLLASG